MRGDGREVVARLQEFAEPEVGAVEIGPAQETPGALDDWYV